MKEMANAKVLLVDDEEDFTATLAERMEERGLDVDVSSSGAEAIERVRGRSYDAVVLDLAMPGMDGIETMKRLLEDNPDLQVILLTGRATVRDGVEAMSAGAMEFLEKPADVEVLLKKIGKAQENRVLLTEKRVQETITDILRTKGW
jgi:DNA-binding NtrC family response regulator